MYNLKKSLQTSCLFKDFTEKDITNMLIETRYKITDFAKDEIIAIEGDQISHIGIILEGTVEIQKNYPSGKTITVTRMKRGKLFGEVIIFSEMKTYPSTVISTDDSKVLFISKPDIINLCRTHTVFLNNFMGLLSNKILFLNAKLRNLSYQTIREKIVSYLLDEYTRQNNLILHIPFSRKEMAEQFGTTRPSLSRELINMKNDGLIDFAKKTIEIKDLERLEDVLF